MLRKKFTLLFIFILLFSFYGVSAQENPFLKMAGKPYAEYYSELENSAYVNRELRDSEWAAKTAALMREAGKVSKDKKWLLEADYFELKYEFSRYIYLNNPNQTQVDSLFKTWMTYLQEIILRARKIKAVDIELRAMNQVWFNYLWYLKNYEMAFRYSLEIDKVLSKVSAKDYPLKPLHYYEMGKLYYDFGEYETAKLFFEKGLENPEITNEQIALRQSWNSLGLIYRYHYKDLDKSDSCFYKIFDVKPQQSEELSPRYQDEHRDAITKENLRAKQHNLQERYELWKAIAKGNLGTNCYLRGEYDKAIPLLQFGMEKTTDNNPYNYSYAAGKAITLAEIFLEKQNLPQAKQYAGKAFDFLILYGEHVGENGMNRNTKLWEQYFQFMSRYYRAIGNDGEALLYADSAMTARLHKEEEFNLMKLHRAEQKTQQEKLLTEKVRSKTYRQNLITVSAFALLLLLMSVQLYRLYRKKQAAYKDLVIKTQQWAEVPVTDAETETDLPDHTDKIIFESLTQFITDKNLYRNYDLTLDQIAQQLGINRVYLSQAINRCYGNHFNNFINEFRVKEAVKLMSDKKNNPISIEGIALDSGFNDRKTFYRAFKRFTGLSPSEFRKNLLL